MEGFAAGVHGGEAGKCYWSGSPVRAAVTASVNPVVVPVGREPENWQDTRTLNA
jgi:hypothetical protein